MKNIFSSLILILLFSAYSVQLHAQSPKEKRQIIDDAVKQDSRGNFGAQGMGTIKLKDGTLIDGRIVFNITPSMGSQGVVQYFPENRMSPDNYYPSKVEYFQIGEAVFYPLDVKFEGNSYVIFAQMLNNSRDDKMVYYRLMIADVSSQGNPSPYILKKGYFVKMKGDDRATQIGGVTLVPFAKSMSKNVADCPDLAKKIKEKEDGYKVSFLDLDSKNDDVYFRILEEYLACK